jgi:hypothetical protein
MSWHSNCDLKCHLSHLAVESVVIDWTGRNERPEEKTVTG